MINNIKSLTIFKKIFNNNNENKILKIIKYNKEIQKKLNYNIDDYKQITLIKIIFSKNNNNNDIYCEGSCESPFKRDEENIKIYYNNKKWNQLGIREQIRTAKIILNKKVINLKCLFKNQKNIIEIIFEKFNKNIFDMSYMFYKCEKLKYVKFNNFRTPNIKYMNSMFENCESLEEIDWGNLNTQNVLDMDYMFANCSKIKKINLNNFNTDNLQYMNFMFCGCSSLKELNLDNFNTKKVCSMNYTFCRCSSLEKLNLLNFDTKNVRNMDGIFKDCSSLKELKYKFETPKVKHVCEMFYGCLSLNK